MKKSAIKYPIVLFLYKRPQATDKLLKLIIENGFNKLYIFLDGPKDKQDIKLNNQVKQVITRYQKKYPKLKFQVKHAKNNLSLAINITQGLNAVFEKESAAIVLEDDCVPNSYFFPFLQSMLTKYAKNQEIMSVTGSGVGKCSQYSYDFSRYQQCWGWGTWARAWKHYDPKLRDFGNKKWQNHSRRFWPGFYMRWYWSIMLMLTKKGQIPSWAFKWSYAHFANDGLAIIPTGNLINNIGFDDVATNTKAPSPLSSIPLTKMNFPLNHPRKITENIELTSQVEKYYYRNPIAFLGMLRQLILWRWKKYAHRN